MTSPFLDTPWSDLFEAGGAPAPVEWELTNLQVNNLGFGYNVNDTFTINTTVPGAPYATGIVVTAPGGSLGVVAIVEAGTFLADPTEVIVGLTNIIGSGLFGELDVTGSLK